MRGSARGDERRAQLVDVALDLIVERGFAALTLDAVATHAGASKSTLMRFFGGRQGLIEAALARELEIVLGPLADSTGDLDGFAATFQQVIFSSRCLQLLRYVVSEGATDPSVGETFRVHVLGTIADLVRPAMTAASGEAASVEDVEAAIDRYLGDLIGVEILRALSGGAPDPARLASYREKALRRPSARG